MNNGSNRLLELAFKHLSGELNEDELKELDDYLNESEANRRRFEKLTNHATLIEGVQAIYNADKKRMWQNIAEVSSPLWRQKARIITIRSFLKYAAAIILIAALTAYWFLGRHSKTELTNIPAITPTQNDILPGSNRAILTLASGQKITLDSAANGQLAKEGKTEIVKTSDGQLAYNSQNTSKEVFYNMVATPRGGQYQLTLSDGTKVWMNAASVLHFPSAFVGPQREVQLEGEAYFEVAKNDSKPFIVKLKSGMRVQVLGTHFNIMAYSEEKETKTTLLEGAVKISTASEATTLHPGEQALVQNASADIRVNKEADLDEAVAWKNGTFKFNNADVKMIMRQIARWYDVDISYEGQLPERRFTGSMSRNLRVSELLSGIEFIGVKFRIEGKKIVVQP